MTENENFLVSIGFTQEEYMGNMWWVDPFFDKEDQYRYVFNGDEGSFSVNGKSIEWIMKAIKANVSNQARVSTDKTGDELFDKPEKLIRHLILNSHWSPLDMVNLGFEIETSRAISLELVRHKSMNFQQASQFISQ